MCDAVTVTISLCPDLGSSVAAGECTCEDVEHARRHPGLQRQLSQAQGGKRGVLRHLAGEEGSMTEGAEHGTDQTQASRVEAERSCARKA